MAVYQVQALLLIKAASPAGARAIARREARYSRQLLEVQPVGEPRELAPGEPVPRRRRAA